MSKDNSEKLKNPTSESEEAKKSGRLQQTTMGNFLACDKKEKKPSMKKKKSVLDDESSYFTSYRHNDLEQYRQGYPGKRDDNSKKDNELFYKNELKSYPDGDYIDNILKKWKGNYDKLERHHGYIQWLFPIRETGMNFHAQELQMHEINAIMDDSEAFGRVLSSYEMMLDFYGMKLSNKETGKITRASNWKVRFTHLNRSYHNYLRITRILKFLGEFGYENYKRPFVEFVLEEAMEHETLTNTLESCVRYWLETIKSAEDRKQLRDYVHKMESGHTSPYEEDDTELVSDKRVDKMIEKSNQNQAEFKNGEEGNQNLDEPSNAECKANQEKLIDARKISTETTSCSKNSEPENITCDKGGMEDGDNRDPSKDAEEGNVDELEKRDLESLTNQEEERMMKMNKETPMDVDPEKEGEDALMDTSGADIDDSQRTPKLTRV